MLVRWLLSTLGLVLLAALGVAGVVGTALGVAGFGLLLTHEGAATLRYWVESSVALVGGLAAVALATAGLFRQLRPRRAPRP